MYFQDVDACNGVWSGDRSQYFYVGTRWHPYGPGCNGPANSPHKLRVDPFYPQCSLNGLDKYGGESTPSPQRQWGNTPGSSTPTLNTRPPQSTTSETTNDVAEAEENEYLYGIASAWTHEQWAKILISAICALIVVMAICSAVFVEWKFKWFSKRSLLQPTTGTIVLGQVETPPADTITTGTAGATFHE